MIRNEAWNRPRGSQQLSFIWDLNSHTPVGKILRPKILHLDTQCYDQHLIDALKMIPEVEELVLGLVTDLTGDRSPFDFLPFVNDERVRRNHWH